MVLTPTTTKQAEQPEGRGDLGPFSSGPVVFAFFSSALYGREDLACPVPAVCFMIIYVIFTSLLNHYIYKLIIRLILPQIQKQ